MRSQNAERRTQNVGVRAGLLLGLLLVALAGVRAEDHGIIVSGGDPNGDISDWRKGLADEFEKEFKRRSGDTSEVSRPVSEDDIKKAIADLKGKVECGEDIVFYFNGHGSSGGSLCLTWNDSRGRHDESVSPDEFLKWLKDAALPCSCRIHLIVHACYSGEFIERVAKGDIHVVTAVSSATDSRPAHKDVRGTVQGGVVFDGNDWPTGFDEDIDTVPADEQWQPAIQKAKASAKEKMRDKWEDKDKPQTWKRFKNCHVEEVTVDPKTKVKTVKLKSPDGTEHTVVLGPGSKVKVGDQELEYCVLTVCSYVTVLVQESDKGVYEVRQCVASLNISGATGHVQDRWGNSFSMHFDAPPHLKCKTLDVKLPPGATLPEWVRFCKWVRLDSCYQESTGITVGDVTETDPPVIDVKGHVQSADPKTGEFEIHIMEPSWLKCNTVKGRVKAGERLPGWVRKCKWIRLKGKLTDSLVDVTGVTETEPQVVGYRGHVRAVKDGRATVHIQDPDWLLCEVKVLQPPPGTALPNWVKPCTTVYFQGPLTGDTIRLRSFGEGVVVQGTEPINIWFTAHVESVGPDYIVVTINTPERMAGQKRRLKVGQGVKIPDGVEFCKTISFAGNIIFDSIINGRSIRLTGEPERNDAGVHRIVAPGAEVPGYVRVTPEAEVRNHGTQSITMLPVTCVVESAGVSVYEDSTAAAGLEPGAISLVQFREWQPAGPGTAYDVIFATRLPGDENPSNDRIARPVVVAEAENHPPVLLYGFVEPPFGNTRTPFVYGVTYQDQDGDMPVEHEVIIDGEPFPMEPQGGDPVRGIPFLHEIPGLKLGQHTYGYRFRDSRGLLVIIKAEIGPMVEE